MAKFLTYLQTGAAASAFTKKLDHAVLNARQHLEWRVEYMTFLDSLEEAKMDAREEGLAEGRAEGLAEGRAEGLAEGRAEGLAAGRAEGIAAGRAEVLEMSLAEARERVLIELVCKKLRKGICDITVITEDLEEDETRIKMICQAADPFAPDYPPEDVYKTLHKQNV